MDHHESHFEVAGEQPFSGVRRRADIAGAFADAVRENPVAAGLIGLGALWLLMGGNKVSLTGGGGRRSAVGAVAHGVGGVAQGAGRAAGRMGHAMASGVRSGAEYVSDYVGGSLHGVDAEAEYRNPGVAEGVWDDTQPERFQAFGSQDGTGSAERTRMGASRMGARMSDMGEKIGEKSRAMAAQVSDEVQTMFQRHPMSLGLAGLALGAGVAAILPVTRTERDALGQVGERARDKVSEVAAQASELARAAIDEVSQGAGSSAGEGPRPGL